MKYYKKKNSAQKNIVKLTVENNQKEKKYN